MDKTTNPERITHKNQLQNKYSTIYCYCQVANAIYRFIKQFAENKKCSACLFNEREKSFSVCTLKIEYPDAGSYTGSADSVPGYELAHRRIAAQRQPANTWSKRA